MSIITLYKLDEPKKRISPSLSRLPVLVRSMCVCVCVKILFSYCTLWCFLLRNKRGINVNSIWKNHHKHTVISSDHMKPLIIRLLIQRETTCMSFQDRYREAEKTQTGDVWWTDCDCDCAWMVAADDHGDKRGRRRAGGGWWTETEQKIEVHVTWHKWTKVFS